MLVYCLMGGGGSTKNNIIAKHTQNEINLELFWFDIGISLWFGKWGKRQGHRCGSEDIGTNWLIILKRASPQVKKR